MTAQRLKIKNDASCLFFPLPHIHRSGAILKLSLTYKVKLFYFDGMPAQVHRRIVIQNKELIQCNFFVSLSAVDVFINT